MACMRLSPRGPYRFYAPCCGTPIATTMTSRTVPFAGLLAGLVVEADRLGPVRANVNITGADGKVKHRAKPVKRRRRLPPARGADDAVFRR